MADIAAQSLTKPGIRTVWVAVGLGLFGALLQYGMNGTQGPLDPWRVGCLLTVLGLWSWAAMEGSVVAHHRRGKSGLTFLAQAFAYGYFLAVCLILMQFGTNSLRYGWTIYGIGGLLFGLLMSAAMSNRDVSQSEGYFEQTHALERTLPTRIMFLAWPIASFAVITFLVTQPDPVAFAPEIVAVLMVLFAGIWPLPYDITEPHRKSFVSLMVIGLGLLALVLMVP